jgi:hypothetical protein
MTRRSINCVGGQRSFTRRKTPTEQIIADGIAVAQAFAQQFLVTGANTPHIG